MIKFKKNNTSLILHAGSESLGSNVKLKSNGRQPHLKLQYSKTPEVDSNNQWNNDIWDLSLEWNLSKIYNIV